jgi:hypothetical protein
MFARTTLLFLASAALLVWTAASPSLPAAGQPVGATAVIIDPGSRAAAVTEVMAAAFRAAGLEARRAALEQAAERSWWDALGDAIVALPDARRMPASSRWRRRSASSSTSR